MRKSPGLAIGAIALSFSAIVATPALADPPLWRVRDADTEMVLFGSVHSLPADLEWRTAELDRAIAEADLIAFEILEPESEAAERAMVMPMMRYFMGARPLSEAVSPDTYARVMAAAARYGLPGPMLNLLRPWAAGLMLDMASTEALGSSGDLGVDTVLESGLAAGRRKEALDTPELLHATMAALADTSDADAEQFLVEMLDAIEDGSLELDLEQAWAAGDVDQLREEVASMKREAPRLYQALLVDRNEAWMAALRRMMDTEGRVVVVAGAAHMVGDDGLPALLRRAGYEVEGP